MHTSSKTRGKNRLPMCYYDLKHCFSAQWCALNLPQSRSCERLLARRRRRRRPLPRPCKAGSTGTRGATPRRRRGRTSGSRGPGRPGGSRQRGRWRTDPPYSIRDGFPFNFFFSSPKCVVREGMHQTPRIVRAVGFRVRNSLDNRFLTKI
jgi:hypothetical protein